MTLEDWVEIRRLHVRGGMSVPAIAKHLKIARDTVARAAAAEVPPRYVRTRQLDPGLGQDPTTRPRFGSGPDNSTPIWVRTRQLDPDLGQDPTTRPRFGSGPGNSTGGREAAFA
jgi:hypothetical protein